MNNQSQTARRDMPDRPPAPALLRLGGAFALLLLVAPLGSIYRVYSLWYPRQEMVNLHSDPVVQVAAAATAMAHASRPLQQQQQQQQQQQSEESSTRTSCTDNSEGLSPGFTNIGSFSVNGEEIDENISMEELLSLLGVGFGQRHHHHHHIAMQKLDLGLGIGGTRRSRDIAVGVHLITPWILALLFGVAIPAVLAVVERIKQRRGRQYFDNLSSKEKRLFRLIECFGRFKKTIRGDDLIIKVSGASKNKSSGDRERYFSGDEDNGVAENNEEGQLLRIPRAGSPLLPAANPSACVSQSVSSIQTSRQVPATCTICLEQYRAGDVVVWSSNADCRDHFHQSCIISWLSKRRGGSDARCPCCRQHFIDHIFRNQAGFNSK